MSSTCYENSYRVQNRVEMCKKSKFHSATTPDFTGIKTSLLFLGSSAARCVGSSPSARTK